ncbi:hypothetical protein KI372_09700, partial [Halobacterium salinarum]|nr:hypothetical protein [Halobacterium salinarum]
MSLPAASVAAQSTRLRYGVRDERVQRALRVVSGALVVVELGATLATHHVVGGGGALGGDDAAVRANAVGAFVCGGAGVDVDVNPGVGVGLVVELDAAVGAPPVHRVRAVLLHPPL